MELETVSIGSTPSMMHDFRSGGSYGDTSGNLHFMDASQANAYGSLDRNAATVLTTIISRPTAERVITDVGAKGITAQTRSKGFCATQVLGLLRDGQMLRFSMCTMNMRLFIINNSVIM